MRRHHGHRESNLAWDHRSVHWYSHDPGRLENMGNALWMCAEDVGNSIWSHFYRFENEPNELSKKPVWLENCPKDLEEIICECLPNTHGDDLSRSVMDFVKSVAQELILVGESHLELSIGWEGKPPVVEPTVTFSP